MITIESNPDNIENCEFCKSMKDVLTLHHDVNYRMIICEQCFHEIVVASKRHAIEKLIGKVY